MQFSKPHSPISQKLLMKTENLYIVYPIINIPTISKIKEQFDGSYWFSPDKQLAFKGVFLKLMNPYTQLKR